MLEILSNIYQIYFLLEVVASLPVGFIFFENNASKEKRSVENWLIFIKFCHHKGGHIPLTSEMASLVVTMFSFLIFNH